MANQFVKRKIALAFYFFDQSKDGYMREEDFLMFGKSIAESLGYAEGSDGYNRLQTTYAQLWQSFGKPADINGDGSVTLDEYIKATFNFLAMPNAAEYILKSNESIFDAIDANGNGSISRSEYAAFLKPNGFTEEEASKVFDKLDRDSSGVMTRSEFAQNHLEYWTSEDVTAVGNWSYGNF